MRAPEGEPFTAAPEPSSARRESPENRRTSRGKAQKRRKPPPGLPGAASAWFPAISSWSHRLPPQARVGFDRERLRIEARANGAAIMTPRSSLGHGPTSHSAGDLWPQARYRVCGSRLHDDFPLCARGWQSSTKKIARLALFRVAVQPTPDVTRTCDAYERFRDAQRSLRGSQRTVRHSRACSIFAYQEKIASRPTKAGLTSRACVSSIHFFPAGVAGQVGSGSRSPAPRRAEKVAARLASGQSSTGPPRGDRPARACRRRSRCRMKIGDR